MVCYQGDWSQKNLSLWFFDVFCKGTLRSVVIGYNPLLSLPKRPFWVCVSNWLPRNRVLNSVHSYICFSNYRQTTWTFPLLFLHQLNMEHVDLARRMLSRNMEKRISKWVSFSHPKCLRLSQWTRNQWKKHWFAVSRVYNIFVFLAGVLSE